jgi:PAS domain S-box-containing protein
LIKKAYTTAEVSSSPGRHALSAYNAAVVFELSGVSRSLKGPFLGRKEGGTDPNWRRRAMQFNLSALSNLRVFQKGLILVGMPLLLNFVMVGMLFFIVMEADRQRLDDIRNKKIYEDSNRAMLLIFDVGFSLKSAFEQMDPAYFARFKQDILAFSKTKKELLQLADQDPKSAAKMHRLVETLSPAKEYLPLLSDMAQHKLSPAKLIPLFSKMRRDAKHSSTNMVQVFRENIAEQKSYLAEFPKKQAALRQMQFGILFGGMMLNIASALFLARFFMTNIADRLKIMTDNTERMANEAPLNPPLSGKDEIAELDSVFHSTAKALAKAAQKERAAFDHASDVICVLDADGKFIRMNKACTRLWGWQPDNLLGKSITELVAPEDIESTSAAVKTVQSGQAAAEFENRIKHGDGHELCILWSVYWSDVENSLFCVAHDITERKQAEQMKQDFLGMVSHDLRSPLTSIYGVFQLIAAKAFGDLPEMASKKLGMAAKNVNRLLNLVNDLLDIEKLEAGQMEMEREEVQVADLLKRSVQDIEALAEQRKINVVIDCNAQAFSLDMDRMMQVLVNLLSNAIKFSPEGGTVKVSARESADGLELKVIDEGRGVPASHREAIFERFKQVEAADGKRKSGTGLGLPICKQIVELHGGTIGVDSADGKGSTFWMKIPFRPHELETTKLKALPKQAFPGKSMPKPQYKEAGNQPAKPGFSPLGGLSLAQKGSVVVGVPVLFGVILVLTLTVVLMRADAKEAKERHYQEIAVNSSELLRLMYDAGTAMASDRTPESWQRFESAAKDLIRQKQVLETLTKDDPNLSGLMSQIDDRLKVPQDFMERALAQVEEQGNAPVVLQQVFEGHEALEPVMAELEPLVDRLSSEAKRMESDSPSWLIGLKNMLLSGLGFSILTSLLLAVFFSRGVTSRLYVLRDNSRRLASEKALNPPLSGRDEISQLDTVFHAMARTLREARQKERAVFDNSQDVICAIDRHGIFRQVNPACERMWGYPIEYLLDRNICDIVCSEDVETTRKNVTLQSLEEQQRSFENRVVCKDSTLRDILWNVSWSPSESLYFCTAHDISKRKELERLKQEFLAMVSHDLRTPLTAILGVSKLGTAGAFGALPEKAAKQLEVITRNVDRLLNLINDLLDIEKLESGQMQLTIENIPAYSVLERSYQALDNFAEQKHVKLVAEPSDEQIAGDPDRLIQVLVNLISNAIKFSPEGGTVTLSAVPCQEFVEIRVRDEGRGVPEKFKEAIFERYKQVEASDGKRKSGTGLGLPICKQIVLSHGGTIGVESEIGKGSTFWFRIPKVRQEDVIRSL